MTDLRKYVPLRTLVSYYLDEQNKSQKDFDKCWVLAFRGLADMGFDLTFEPLTVNLPVEANNTVILPSDYISWTKIGIINASGEVTTLKINNSLTKLRDLNPNRVQAIAPNVPDVDYSNLIQSPYYINYYFGGWYTPLFGLGNGLLQHGECVVDEKNGVIVMGTGYAYANVILEYISSPERNGDYEIETAAQEAIIAFVSWKMKTGSDQDYYHRKTEARRRLKPVRWQVLQEAIRANSGYKIKA